MMHGTTSLKKGKIKFLCISIFAFLNKNQLHEKNPSCNADSHIVTQYLQAFYFEDS